VARFFPRLKDRDARLTLKILLHVLATSKLDLSENERAVMVKLANQLDRERTT
jgi:hypothetical protein